MAKKEHEHYIRVVEEPVLGGTMKVRRCIECRKDLEFQLPHKDTWYKSEEEKNE